MKNSEIICVIQDEVSGLLNINYSDVAQQILDKHPSITKSHRTVRRMVAKEFGKCSHIKKLPSVLIFDIETSPMEVFVWGLYKQRVNPDNVIKDWNIISWAAKWLFDPDVMSDVLTSDEAIDGNDKRIVKSLWNLFEKADVIIAHNAKKFDIRKSNSRFILSNMHPPSPYQVIDTLEQSRKWFAHSSHKLNYLSQIMFNKAKIETDFGLWKSCMNGDADALKEMVDYNIMDVKLLEELYMEMRGWMKSHPNLRLYGDTDERVCHVCLSKNLSENASEYVTPAGRFQSFRCTDCGAISRVRKSNLTKKEKETMVVATAR